MSFLGACAVPHPPLILPEIGRGEEKKISDTIEAYESVAEWVVENNPDLVVITSPHATMYADYMQISSGASAEGNFANFGHPELAFHVEYDEEFVQQVSKTAEEIKLPAGTLGRQGSELDHGTMIPLYFLQKAGYKGKIVRIGLSGLSNTHHYTLGVLLRETADIMNRRMMIVASGDLSHKLKADGPYGFAKEGPVFDQRMADCFATGDFLELLTTPVKLAEGAAECGLRSFWIMAGAFDCLDVDAKLLSCEGPFGVGYGVARFIPKEENKRRNIGEQAVEDHRKSMEELREKEDVYLRLARKSLESYVRYNKRIEVPEGLPEEMLNTRAGAFVSIKKAGQLRGCIGTILPVRDSLASEIIANAVSAGTADPRFPAVTEDELEDLVYDVDVLSEPESIEGPEQLDVKRYGVIVSSEDGYRRGLLLPDLEGIDTVEEQIDIARRKGGISPDENVKLQRFEVTRHE
ncbi:putative ACR [Anaerovibrio sp. JC8]|uniref:AmmeMemoRadiSam system protein A n=1 Tax=Anaerovibrio sp. JC8 TaxID=1240085 RepID=UPI000A0CA201|nr:AmmeMemoRadiSam system protein A [Anaerovibrio sp. JC8]ORU01455.1 putative ACR [Anaerovibrio sp. JC8]